MENIIVKQAINALDAKRAEASAQRLVGVWFAVYCAKEAAALRTIRYQAMSTRALS